MGIPFPTNITATNEAVKSLSPVYPAPTLVWLNALTAKFGEVLAITNPFQFRNGLF